MNTHIERADIVPEKLVPEGVFMKNKKLSELIEVACDPKMVLTYELVTNIVLRYIFLHRYSELGDISDISLSDIEFLVGVYSKHNSIVKGFDGKKADMSSNDKNLYESFIFTQNTRYQIDMLIDIAPTVELFMDIANRKRNDTDTSTFIGMDLGTGSGILLLAQYIQAKRNGYRNIMNLGFEVMEFAGLAAKAISQTFNFGEVFTADTTSVDVYEPLRDTYISHISNENISNPQVSMRKIKENFNNGRNPDPFYENLETLYTTLNKQTLQQTTFFPNAIEICLKNLLPEDSVKTGGPKNGFGIQTLLEIEERFRKTHPQINTEHPDWRIYNHIFSQKIELNGRMIPLSSIGNSLLERGVVTPNPNLKLRWKHSPKTSNLLS